MSLNAVYELVRILILFFRGSDEPLEANAVELDRHRSEDSPSRTPAVGRSMIPVRKSKRNIKKPDRYGFM